MIQLDNLRKCFYQFRILPIRGRGSTKCLNRSSTPVLAPDIMIHFWTISTQHRGEREKISGSQIGIRGNVAANKASRQALSDHITGHQATFNSAQASLLAGEPNKRPASKPKPAKAPKAGSGLCMSQDSGLNEFS